MVNREDNKEEVAVYEVGFLILPSIAEDKLPNIASSIKDVISKAGGEEIDSEMPFKHPLAYSMSKTVGASRYVLDEAYIGWIKFEVEPSSIVSIKSALEKMDEIVRFLLIKAPRETTFTFAEARAKALESEQGSEGDAPQADREKEGAAAQEVVN